MRDSVRRPSDATPQPRELVFASLMAESAMPFCRALADYLGAALGVRVHLLDQVPWQEARRRVYEGEAHLGIVCGLQYVCAPSLELVAAPVMRSARYGGRPVYFSDVVVRAQSPFASMHDLRGARWAFNEPTSHSGYGVVRYTLAARGERSAFFGRVVEAGSHARSLTMLLRAEIDGAAIDSTVLEQALRDAPSLASELRVIETLGPSPIPPVVASRSLPPELIDAVRRSLTAMHLNPLGQSVLSIASMRQLVPVWDADYDPIRTMASLAAELEPWPQAQPVES